jgi:rod shape determining protein RodA
MLIVLALVDLRVWFAIAYPVYGIGLLLLIAVEVVGDRAWARSAGSRWGLSASSPPR